MGSLMGRGRWPCYQCATIVGISRTPLNGDKEMDKRGKEELPDIFHVLWQKLNPALQKNRGAIRLL